MKKIYTIAALLFLPAMFLIGCTASEPEKAGTSESESESTQAKNTASTYIKIAPEEAKTIMDSDKNIIILDVRTAEEYEEKHIPGALLIPNEDIQSTPMDQLPDMDKQILVYCRSGNRSAQAAKKLIEAGYTKVYDFGGINDWPFETETGPAAETTETLSAADGLLGKFTTTDLDGNTVNETIFTNANLTMLNIWGTFCGPCIREMPDLGALSEEYKDQMQIVGLISDVVQADNDTARQIIDYTGADYTHLVSSADLSNGYLRQVQLVPTTIFLDKEGKQVGDIYSGSRSKSEWKKIIDKMLEKVNS